MIDISKISQFHGGLPEKNVIRINLVQEAIKTDNSVILQAQATASSALIFTFLANNFVGYSLSSLWGMINGI